MLLCKHTVGGVTALNEIHTAHLHHTVMIATCTWLVSIRSTASHDATITIHKRNTNIQEFCTLLNPLLILLVHDLTYIAYVQSIIHVFTHCPVERDIGRVDFFKLEKKSHT